MHTTSSLISKVAKAKLYSDEPERIQFEDFVLTIRGDNAIHTIGLHDGSWTCTCHTFRDDGFCAHTMAVERLLGVTIPAAYRVGEPFGTSGIHQQFIN
jgi:hypothetical protein